MRHAFATRLMEQGTPMKDIADMLGHRSIETTFLYTKVDVERLRLLAVDWPEVQR
jgi:site-specific recombinase XerD